MINRFIFVYWDGEESNFLKYCIKKMKLINYGWTIFYLNKDNIYNFIDHELIFNTSTLIQHKSDWFRLSLLEKFGGVWLDISTIFHNHIENWVDINKNEVQLFKSPKSVFKNAYENWAIAAPKSHPIITRWKKEFKYAFEIGFNEYKEETKYYIMQDVWSLMPYFTQHGCLLKILTEESELLNLLSVTDSEQMPLKFLFDSNWDPYIFANIIEEYKNTCICFTKIPGFFRHKLENINSFKH